MRIFVLDDDMERINWFKENWENVYYAHNPIEAEKMLRTNEYNVIWLDNDLGGAAFTRGTFGDGIDLARIMARDELHVDVPTIVHSMNYPASENIISMLKPTHKNLFRIDYFTLRNMNPHEVAYVIEHKLKPFYRGK